MINILLVDDHQLVRTGIRRIIEDENSMRVVGEAESGEEAVKWCRANYADVILMDMKMPGMGGLEATKKILRLSPDTKVIVLSIHVENPFPSKVMQAGASGYLSKDANPEEMLRAIRLVKSGQRYIALAIAQKIALDQLSPSSDPFKSLSEREWQIMHMVIQGQKPTDISKSLNLSIKTVSSYRARLFEKLQVNGDVELMHLAIRHGVLDTQAL